MATFGISIISASGSIIESADVEQKAEFKQLISSTGTHSEARTFDVTFSVSLKGKGDTCPFVAGSSSGMPGVTSGKGIWTNVTLDSKNDDFRGWSASATVYKNAS
jgi:hypothetical protein